ncbi:hypothetical protein, partial [Staphylococcus aureus]|uniref:hypothetical protein n=1 Tax=Staphylococcus aureus TaxID=1280 RepID=UPI0028CB23DB
RFKHPPQSKNQHLPTAPPNKSVHLTLKPPSIHPIKSTVKHIQQKMKHLKPLPNLKSHLSQTYHHYQIKLHQNKPPENPIS